VRQQVDHQKTFLNLEQNLLKQKFASKVLKVEPAEHGVDFFFKSENDSIRYLDYIKSNLPVLMKNSKQLISHNERDNTSNIKTTFSMTIPKICRDDLVKIPPKLCK
jgi:nonsense-mediated mRNA decay protein 3